MIAALTPVHDPVHGDFYADQVLVGPDYTAILDFDEAVRGDPATDVGNFVAHLEREALQELLRPRAQSNWRRPSPMNTGMPQGTRSWIGWNCMSPQAFCVSFRSLFGIVNSNGQSERSKF